MPTTYASPDDIEHERIDTDPAWDDVKVQNLLEDVEDLVKLGRDLPARIAAGRTTVGLVRRVILEIVLGALRNPDGLASNSVSETAGPYTQTAYRMYGSGSRGAMAISRDQRRMLGDKLGGIRTANPSRGHAPRPWVPGGWC